MTDKGKSPKPSQNKSPTPKISTTVTSTTPKPNKPSKPASPPPGVSIKTKIPPRESQKGEK